MRAVSENVIFGQLMPMGTGSFDVHIDDTREKAPDGSLGTCFLDQATPVLPSSREEDLFAVNTPIGPGTVSPLISFTPYDASDAAQPVAMSTGGTYAEIQTPEETPATPASQAGMSPFSPEVKAGDSPFSTPGGGDAGGGGGGGLGVGGYTPPYSDFASPATNLEYSPASPSYSPADRADQEDTKDFAQMSPTYSPRSVAYTPSGSTLYDDRAAPASRPAKKQATGLQSRRTAATTTSAGRTTPGTSPAWSPTYSPSLGSGVGFYEPSGTDTPLTSPMYTPMSTEYGAIPTSPVYTPTSPTQPAGGGGSSYRSSPYGAMTSPGDEAPARSDVRSAGASPEIQASTVRAASPGYEDVVTSPSYTPQEAPAQRLPQQAAEDVVYSAGVSELDDEDAMSELFEPEDDE